MHTPNLATKNQGGAALVIGLILLLILTVLGVSGLGTATTEVRLADNNKQREYTFQSAESALQASLRNGGLIEIDSTEVENTPVRADRQYTYEHVDAENSVEPANIDVTVRTLYRGQGLPSGSECGNYDAQDFTMVHFMLDSRATGSRGARSAVRQGFCVPAPRP